MARALQVCDDCKASCVCVGITGAECKKERLKCLAGKAEGVSFPILQDPFGTVTALFQGGDVSIIEFVAPPVEFGFLWEFTTILYAPPPVKLTIGFEFTAVATFGVLYDTKG